MAGLGHVVFGPARVAGEHVPGSLMISHGRLDRARADGVAPDAVRSELKRDVAHQPDQAVLGGHVVRGVLPGLQGVH